MKSLVNISLAERIHFMKCSICSNYFDMRNLSEVFAHEHATKLSNKLKKHISRKKGENCEWFAKKKVNLN